VLLFCFERASFRDINVICQCKMMAAFLEKSLLRLLTLVSAHNQLMQNLVALSRLKLDYLFDTQHLHSDWWDEIANLPDFSLSTIKVYVQVRHSALHNTCMFGIFFAFSTMRRTPDRHVLPTLCYIH
jgi:hypothetical protein